jgi:hypothetical protein
MGLNNWINPPPSNQHVFFLSNFLNLVNFVGKKMEKNGKNSANSRKNIKHKTLAKRLGSQF